MEFPDSNNEQFHKQLKEKLDAFSAKAPDGLWNEIAFDMNQQENEKRTPIDDLVKSAAERKRTAPEFIWYGIEQKLNLDKVWDEMQPRLNRLRTNYRIKKALSYLSAAAILLLFVRNCDFNSISDNNSALTENNLNSKEIIQKQVDKNQGQLSPNTFIPNKLAKKSNTNTVFNAIKIAATNEANNFFNKNKSQESIAVIDLQHLKKSQENNVRSIVVSEKPQTDNFIKKAPDVIDVKNSELALLSENELSVKTDLLSDYKKSKTAKYSIGLISSLRTTIFIDDQNSRKLNRISTGKIDLVPNLTFSYAVQIGAQFGKHGFDAEFWYNNKVVQEYRYIVGGRTHSDLTKIDYLKINLLYRPQLFSYGKNKIVANAGIYISNLKGVSYSSTRHNFNNISADLNLWENGLVLGLGQEHSLSKQIALDYGFRNEIGLSGIFKSGKNNILNTKLIGFIAYMSLRYRF
jgi:hypothetical protein